MRPAMTITARTTKHARARLIRGRRRGWVLTGAGAALASALGLCWTQLASAGDWQLTPRLSMGETYTDNVRLVETGKRGDFITSITPGLSLRGSSARLESNIDYNLQQLLYGHLTDFNSTNHQLQSRASATIIKDWIFFDTFGQMSQQAIDNRGQFIRNNRGPEDNRRDVTSYQFMPSIRHAFGSWVNLDASYANFTVDQSGGGATSVEGNSSDEDSYRLSLASGRRFSRTPIRVFAERRETSFDSGRTSELQRYGGEGSYVVNRQFRFNVTGGEDDNSFQSSSGNQSGPYWTVGGTWTPSARTSLSGAWGKRFFGDTFNVSGSHQHRRWRIDGAYSEEVQTANEFERQLVLIPLLDAQGMPVFDPVTSSQVFVPIDTPSATDDVFVVKQGNVGIGYTMRRGSANLRLFQFDRQFQNGGFSELTRGASVNFDWRLSRRLGWGFSSYWRENGRTSDEGSGSVYGISPSLNYSLGPHTTALLRYEFTRNDGGAAGIGGADRYTENALTANLVFNL